MPFVIKTWLFISIKEEEKHLLGPSQCKYAFSDVYPRGSEFFKKFWNSKSSELSEGGGGVKPNWEFFPNFPVFFSDASPNSIWSGIAVMLVRTNPRHQLKCAVLVLVYCQRRRSLLSTLTTTHGTQKQKMFGMNASKSNGPNKHQTTQQYTTYGFSINFFITAYMLKLKNIIYKEKICLNAKNLRTLEV